MAVRTGAVEMGQSGWIGGMQSRWQLGLGAVGIEAVMVGVKWDRRQ